jgi:rRNA maturation RNase YbeY
VAVGHPENDVDVLVVDDAEIAGMNARFLGVDSPTDVLAFPLEVVAAGGTLLGQVVISAETAQRQARRLRVPVALEMDLLATHAILHLVGYDDRDPLEAEVMHRRERQILETDAHVPARLWDGLLP